MHFFKRSSYQVVPASIFFLASCGGGSSTSDPKPPQNVVPTITVMADSELPERAAFSFTAEAQDTDGTITTYLWQQTSGTSVTDLVADSATLSFTSPSIAVDEVIGFSLTVTDNNNATATENVNVSIKAYPAISTVSFADSGLQSCLIADESNDIGIDSIICDQTKISSLDDIVHFEKLTSLSITNADLDDISALQDNVTLTSINFANNNISEIAALENLTQLTKLDLSHNKVNVFENTLSELTNLTELNLKSATSGYSYDDFDVESLNEVTKLVKLNLSQLNLSHVDKLADLVNLEELDLASVNSFNSLSFLLSLDKIKVLNLSGNYQLNDLSALQGKSSLEKLDLSALVVEDYSPLSMLTSMQELKVGSHDSYSRLSFDLDTIKDMTQLSVLHLNNIDGTGGMPTLANFTSLKELSISNVNTASIGSIANLTSLEVLNISHNRLGDISAINNLVNLTDLNISHNSQLSDLSPLLNHTQLVTLDMSNLYPSYSVSGISLSSLSGLVNLEQLNAQDNKLSDISSLKNLIALKELNLGDTNIDGLFDFSGLKQLHTLDIHSNQITSLNELHSATSLVNLMAHKNNELTDISALKNLTNLQTLNLAYAKLSESIEVLSELSALTTIGLYGSQVTSIAALFDLPLLRSINLGSNSQVLCSEYSLLAETFPEAEITKDYNCLDKPIDTSIIEDENLLECIMRATNDIADLTRLTCWSDEIISLKGIEQFTNLTRLDLRWNSIIDISPIAELTQLYYLALEHNNIEDISTISNLSALSSLNLSNNSIVDTHAVNSLTNLTDLYLSNNSIVDIPDYSAITDLYSLRLDGNLLVDISNLASLTSLHYLKLANNNEISCEQVADLERILVGLYSFQKPSQCN